VTRRELVEPLLAYAAGLEAELALLRHIQRLSNEQQEASRNHDIDRLHQIADERVRLMTGLVRIEHEIRTARHALAEHQDVASQLPGFAEVVELHQKAAALVTRIISADQETMAALREAEVARREATHAIEAGETTLNAYRRVINPSLSAPSLVDRRG
jgi:uncharacterized protein YhaN